MKSADCLNEDKPFADHRAPKCKTTYGQSCHLKRAEGDALPAALCAAGNNMRLLLRIIFKKDLGPLLCLLQTGSLTGFFAELAEIFRLTRVQYSDQRWALARKEFRRDD